MRNNRWILSLIAMTATAAVVSTFLLRIPATAQAQKPGDPFPIQQPKQGIPKEPEYKPGVKFSAIKLVENEAYQKNIDHAIDAINGGDWQDACDFVQTILDSKEDVFVRVELPDPKTGVKKPHSMSVKLLANNLLASLPPDGLNTYEVKFGAQAKQSLDQAKANGSRDQLAEVATRYRHTKAGAEANEMLATTFLDRAEYFPAALRYERLIGPDPFKSKVSDLVLFKATLAFKRAGDAKKADELWEALLPRLKTNGGLTLANGQVAPIKQVQDILKQGVKVEAANPHDWPMVGGTAARNAQARGSPPMLDYVLWSRQILGERPFETGEPEPPSAAGPLLEEALQQHLANPNMPVMPGGFPIATGGLLFYRTYYGITAVNLHELRDKDGNVQMKAGTFQFRSGDFRGSLEKLFTLSEPTKEAVSRWVGTIYKNSGFSNLLFENSTVGTLTTDNRNIYAVDDLAVPIPPKFLAPGYVNNPTFFPEELRPLVDENRLRAFSIGNEGSLVWELPSEADKASSDPKKETFVNTHFICAPLSVGGKLYVLNEKSSGELRLVCLDPMTGKVVGAPQKLGTLKGEHTYRHDIARRVNAIHLAYAEGILVCPTNAGEILGVDLMSQSLAWAYKYRDKPPNPSAFPNPNNRVDPNPYGPISLSYSNWKVSPPVIVDGKVVFTAPDSSAVCCINLRDGSEIWTAPQHDSDLFLAGVFLDRVVIVGKSTVRALKLADGSSVGAPLYTADLPSGQGVASNNIYYLPLRKGEICAIDMDRWAIKARNRASKTGAAPPGNLVFYEGMVLSQTPTAVVAYPQLAAKLMEAETAYTKDSSLKNLLQRGELRLADGQVQKAVDDLLQVLSKKPPTDIVPRTRTRLYEALGDLLQADFAGNSPKYLSEFKDLTKVSGNPTEQLSREARYWRIVAEGREAQGELVEAFLALKEYGASPLFKKDGIPALDDPDHKVPAHLWLRGRISAMFEKATPAKRKALEDRIAEEWQAVKKQKNNVEPIRQFIGMFDVPFAVGREARIELAHAMIQEKTKASFLEAALNLEQLRTPLFRQDAQTGGKALYALAQLEMAKGTQESLRLATLYYRELNDAFAQAVIDEGKTGSDLYQTLAEDPRLRPFLEESSIAWRAGEVKYRSLEAKDVAGIIALGGMVFQAAGEPAPVMRQRRLLLDASKKDGTATLRFVDVAANKQRWSTTLGRSAFNFQFFNQIYDQAAKQTAFHPQANFRFYHSKGQLAVIQVGLESYGLDLDSGKVLWRHTLFDPTKGPTNTGWSVALDEKGQLWVIHTTAPGGTKFRVGHVGSVQATYVALMTQNGLVALDPLKGTTLWTKTGVGPSTEVFGDDQYIYYVETDGPGAGVGRCLRASDGVPVEIPDYAHYYRNLQRIFAGRKLLTAEPGAQSVTMRLYDVPTGKDLWKRTFTNDPAVLLTSDPDQCGVIERNTGKLILLDAHTGKEIVTGSMMQYQVSAQDLKQLQQPALMDDGERFFVALNVKAADGRFIGNSVNNNFAGGVPCLPVNGWLCCLDRKGEFLWHGVERYLNQLIVIEQFKSLPILLLSSRYTEMTPDGRVRHVARTGSLSKSDQGKAIWWSEQEQTGPIPTADFLALSFDHGAGTITLIGQSVLNRPQVMHQFYIVGGGG